MSAPQLSAEQAWRIIAEAERLPEDFYHLYVSLVTALLPVEKHWQAFAGYAAAHSENL